MPALAHACFQKLGQSSDDLVIQKVGYSIGREPLSTDVNMDGEISTGDNRFEAVSDNFLKTSTEGLWRLQEMQFKLPRMPKAPCHVNRHCYDVLTRDAVWMLRQVQELVGGTGRPNWSQFTAVHHKHRPMTSCQLLFETSDGINHFLAFSWPSKRERRLCAPCSSCINTDLIHNGVAGVVV